ncbi:MAG: hypothetical protein JWL70_1783 [Acidimicrobiia bacterium]|nr:hypothetical protein [Acidimicrobiia bacterium]
MSPVDSALGHPLSLLESAELLGRYAWIENRAFEVLGRWSVDEALPAARILFAAHSAHHAWRAELIVGRLPQLADKGPLDYVEAGGQALGDTFEEVLAVSETGGRMLAVYRALLPCLLSAYTRHAGRLSAVSDASTARMLRILGSDAAEDQAEGEKLLRIVRPNERVLAQAETARDRLAQALGAAGSARP